MQHDEQSKGMNGNGHSARPAAIRVERLTKNYYLGHTVVPALRGVNLEVKRGEFVALMGPSGSGKSTFMNLLGCLDRPTSGSYLLDGVPVSKMSGNQLADIRNQKIGFVFQRAGAVVRARLAGPLPRIEEAVRKGEIARVQMHDALLANPW